MGLTAQRGGAPGPLPVSCLEGVKGARWWALLEAVQAGRKAVMLDWAAWLAVTLHGTVRSPMKPRSTYQANYGAPDFLGTAALASLLAAAAPSTEQHQPSPPPYPVSCCYLM